MISLLTSIGAKLALGAVKAKAGWAQVPPVWKKRVIIALALVAAFFAHQWYAHRQLKKADAAGYARAKAEDAKVITQMRTRANTATVNGARIAQEEKSKNDAENARIHSDAHALSVRGPGAARCRPVSDPAVPTASGGVLPAGHQSDAAAGELPRHDGEGELAAVPWTWLVARAEQSDLDRAEVLSWREWYKRESAEWEKLRQPLAKTEK